MEILLCPPLPGFRSTPFCSVFLRNRLMEVWENSSCWAIDQLEIPRSFKARIAVFLRGDRTRLVFMITKCKSKTESCKKSKNMQKHKIPTRIFYPFTLNLHRFFVRHPRAMILAPLDSSFQVVIFLIKLLKIDLHKEVL